MAINFTVPILLETKHYLVVNKPHGLNVERLPQGFPSVEEWVDTHQKLQGVRQPYTGIVHRLDRPVSGVLIVAKKKAALKNLNEQFRERLVKKFYIAKVEGRPPREKDRLIHWIEKDQLHKRANAFSEPRKNAVRSTLQYDLQHRQEDFSFLLIQPVTGKFHQIRVQLAAIGCPIVGDTKYGGTTGFKPDAIALHAVRLIFGDPQSGKQVKVEVPPDF